jgi:hypothetical protein
MVTYQVLAAARRRRHRAPSPARPAPRDHGCLGRRYADDGYHLLDPAAGNGLSIALFEDDSDPAEVKAAIAQRADEIGWHKVPRPAPKSETIYRVIHSG